MRHTHWIIAAGLVTALTACDNSVKERDLVGTWNIRLVHDNVEMALFVELLPDHTSRIHVRTADRGNATDYAGKWSLAGTKLTTMSDHGIGSDEVIKAGPDTLTIMDLDQPGNPITQWTRFAGPIPDVVPIFAPLRGSQQSDVASGAGKAVPTALEPPAVAPQPTPAATLPAQLIDDYHLIESNAVLQYELALDQARSIHIVLDIEENTPIDVMVLSAKAAQKYDAMKYAVMAHETDQFIDVLGKMFGEEEANKFKSGSTFTEADFYGRPLARKGAYRHYETEGVLAAGNYVLFLDNSGDISKTHGDASVHIQVSAKAPD